MSAYVPPHMRGKKPASDSAAPTRSLSNLGLGGGAGDGQGMRGGAKALDPRYGGGRRAPQRDPQDLAAQRAALRGGGGGGARGGAGADGIRAAMRGQGDAPAPASRYGRYGAGASPGAPPPNPYENSAPPREPGDVPPRDRPPPTYRDGSYVSAYDAAATEHHGESVAGVEDDRAQFAKLIGFSRHRREKLGHRRVADDSGNRRKRQSAPRAFGTNDHGRGLDFGDDLPGGTRIEEEDGMVYEMEDGSGVFFCDRFRRYKFFCGAQGLSLLKGCRDVNSILLARNKGLFEGDAESQARQRAEGYALYEEKPNLRRGHQTGEIGTWSDKEYSLPGFQWMYLRMKSWQRFTETWACLERCAHAGLFDAGGSLHEAKRVISIGGGPGYELLAYDYFREYWSSQDRSAWRASVALPRNKAHAFASLDLQPSWQEYTDLLGYGFAQWDVHKPDLQALLQGEAGVVCMLSNIMCYCSDEATADLFYQLLTTHKCAAIVGNERGAEQSILPKLSRRGCVVVKLLDQVASGRDDRQFIVLPPGHPPLQGVPLVEDASRVFPNVPYEEKKGVRIK